RHADPASPDLIFIAWADAARGGSDRGRHLLHHAVKRKYHMRPVADRELLGYLDPRRLERLDFADQRRGIDHQPVADHGLFPGPQDPAGNELQDKGLAIDLHRVAGVVPSLIPHNHLKPVRKKVDDLPFSFVAPLGAKNDYMTHKMTKGFSLYRQAA